jgi:hypothetical protein
MEDELRNRFSEFSIWLRGTTSDTNPTIANGRVIRQAQRNKQLPQPICPVEFHAWARQNMP